LTTMITKVVSLLLACTYAAAVPLTPEVLEATLPPDLLSAERVLDVQVAYMNHPLAGLSPVLPGTGGQQQILPYEARLTVRRSLPEGAPVEMRLQGLSDANWMPAVETRGILLAGLSEGRLVPSGNFPATGFYPLVDGKTEFPPFSGNRVPAAALMSLIHGFLSSGEAGAQKEIAAAALQDKDLAVRIAASALIPLRKGVDIPVEELTDSLEGVHAAAQTAENQGSAQLMLLLVARALPRLEPRLLTLVRDDLSSPSPVFDASSLSTLLLRRALALPASERGESLRLLCTPVTVEVNGNPEVRRIVASLAPVERALKTDPGDDLTAALLEMASRPDQYSCTAQPSGLTVVWGILMARDPSAMRPRLEDFLGGRAPLNLAHPLSVSDDQLLRETAEHLLRPEAP